MVQRSALCRSRRELSSEYLLAKFGLDIAENEPIWFWLILVVSSDLILIERSHPTIRQNCQMVNPGAQVKSGATGSAAETAPSTGRGSSLMAYDQLQVADTSE